MKGTRLTSTLAVLLVTLLALPFRASAQDVNSADIWRSFAEKIEPGKTLRLRLTDGTRLKATLLQVSPDAITIQPKTRVPVPPRRLGFGVIESMEIDTGKGANMAKAAAVGAATGAAAFFGLLMIALSAWAD